MQLSTQTFAQVIEGLRAHSVGRGGGSEKRRSLRIEIESKLAMIPLRDAVADHPLEVLTRDISHTGIGLLQCVDFGMKKQFILFLPRQGLKSVPILCTTVYSFQPAKGLFINGSEFLQELSEDRLAEFENADDRLQKRIQSTILE
ncbi:MAG: hypothetical protein IT446_02230 [Phycisphaerales bacterium]|nr:hypothetical protein [Phycisphaerales bacterium]